MSIEHFKNSLKINSLQENLWFRLGYACMVEEQWLEAAEAYRRYCDIETDVSNEMIINVYILNVNQYVSS